MSTEPKLKVEKDENSYSDEISQFQEAAFEDNRIQSNRPDENISSKNKSLFDRIPIRLHGGRKAYLEIPTPMYEKDKQIIIRQVELLLADEDANQ
jgi:hypothetical protein